MIDDVLNLFHVQLEYWYRFVGPFISLGYVVKDNETRKSNMP